MPSSGQRSTVLQKAKGAKLRFYPVLVPRMASGLYLVQTQTGIRRVDSGPAS